MDANAYLAEMGRIVDKYNADVELTKGDNREFDDVGELQAAKRVHADALRELRTLKQRLTQTEKELHASFQGASAEASAKNHFGMQMLGGRKMAGRVRADSKRAITTNRARTLAPYREVKLRLDDVIRQLSEVGGALSSAIAGEKASAPKKTPRSSGGSLTKQLAELADLHKAGVLSDDEFAAGKAKLLSS
jgi:hypothetical protein